MEGLEKQPRTLASLRGGWWVGFAGLLGMTAVVLGAFGAHGLRERVAPPMLEIYRTGALYHLVHAVAALAVALAAERLRWPRLVVGLFGAGIVVFSGSLYTLAITSKSWLGAITPIGGVMLIAGWAVIATNLWSPRNRAT
jgi:uncharacterized membrane protein YgdD (TMEM256/DUF423 family)